MRPAGRRAWRLAGAGGTAAGRWRGARGAGGGAASFVRASEPTGRRPCPQRRGGRVPRPRRLRLLRQPAARGDCARRHARARRPRAPAARRLAQPRHRLARGGPQPAAERQLAGSQGEWVGGWVGGVVGWWVVVQGGSAADSGRPRPTAFACGQRRASRSFISAHRAAPTAAQCCHPLLLQARLPRHASPTHFQVNLFESNRFTCSLLRPPLPRSAGPLPQGGEARVHQRVPRPRRHLWRGGV